MYANVDSTGNSIIATTASGKNYITSRSKPRTPRNTYNPVTNVTTHHDAAGNTLLGSTKSGKNYITGNGGRPARQASQTPPEMTYMQTLEATLKEMEATMSRIQKQQIIVVGDYDGTNIPITINGIRRKIATVAP